MKKNTIFKTLLAFLLVFSFVFVACDNDSGGGSNSGGGGIPSELVGNWRSNNPSIRNANFVINADGSGSHEMYTQTTVSWSVIGNRLTITTGDGSGSADYSVNGDTLTLTNPSGDILLETEAGTIVMGSILTSYSPYTKQ